MVNQLRTHKTRKAAMILTLWLFMPLTAIAAPDPLVEGARQCTQYFPMEEQRNAIPAHLLAAIASTESGRWHNGLGLALPWPWTINVEGKGYYFNSKAEAIAQVASLQKRGIRSIDVGCMQVNLMHHPEAFANLDQAFEPATNVAYGAKFLRANYDDLHDWVKATAAYHSRTPVYGREYLGQIEKSWNRIVSKVQEARVAQGMQTATIDAPKFSSTPLPAGAATNVSPGATMSHGVKVLHPVTVASASGLHPIRDTHNVRLIQVSEQQTRRSSETMVVRGGDSVQAVAAASYAPSGARVTLADARDVANEVARPTGDSVRQVHIDSGLSNADSGRSAGTSPNAHFVFAN